MRIKTCLTALLLFLTLSSYCQGIVFSSGDFDYEVYGQDSSMVKLTALDGTLKGDIVIPDSVFYEGKTYAVTQINSMGDNPNVLSVSIPQTVTSISSLSSLSGLLNVYVDKDNPNYESIDGVLVNSYNMSLYDIPRGRKGEFSVPDGIKEIRTSFYNGITKLIIPASVTYITYSIGEYITEFEVAYNNTEFSSVNGMLCSKDGKTLIAYPMTDELIVNIPESIDSIGSSAFQQSRQIVLNRLTPPNISCSEYAITGIYVKSDYLSNYQNNPQTSVFNLMGYDVIKDSIFYAITEEGEASLIGSNSRSESIVIPQTITDDKNNTYTITSIGSKAFYQNYSLREIKLPETLKSIGDYAFYGTNIQEITLPASLTEIGKGAFYYCDYLYNVYAECAPIDISAGCFYDYYTLYVPSEYENQYKTAVGWSYFYSIIVKDFTYDDFVLKKLTENTLSVIKYTGSQTDIIIPDEVTINNNTYKITAIGNRVFQEKGLTSIKLPRWLEEIGEYAFDYNPELTSIDFPASLKTIGNSAFNSCRITSLNFPISIESVGNYAFNNYNLKKVVVNSPVPFILGDYPFYTNSGFKIMVFPSSSAETYRTAEGWQDYSSYICGVDAIIDDIAYQKLNDNTVALSCCMKIFNSDENNKLTIPEQVIIDDIDYRVSIIGENAFSSAYDLDELTIPATIDSIGSYAFNYHTILRMESMTPPKANDQTFYSFPREVIVTFAALNTYKTANYWDNLGDLIVAYDTLIDGVVYVMSDNNQAIVFGVMTMPENGILEIPERVNVNDNEYTVSVIGSRAFRGCSGNLLILPQTIDSIASTSAFDNFSFTHLKSTTPPRLGNSNWRNVYVPSSSLESYLNNKQWVSSNWYKQYIHGTDGIIYSDSVIYNINNSTKTAEVCKWMKANTDIIEVPKTVTLVKNSYTITSLLSNLFNDYYNVKILKIPETIIEIGDYVFPSSSNLKVISEAVAPPAIGFYDTYYLKNQSLYVRSAAYNSYNIAEVWKDFGNIVAIDASDDQFYYAKAGEMEAVVTGLKTTSKTEYEIPETIVIDGETLNVTKIGDKLFMNSNVQKVLIPNNIKEIGNMAFYGTSLRQITIPASVEKIGERAFSANKDNSYPSNNLDKIQVRAGNRTFMSKNEKLLLSKDGKTLLQTTRYGGDLTYSYVDLYDEHGYYYGYRLQEINPFDGVEQIAIGALDGNHLSKIKLPSTLADADASKLMYMQYLREIEVDTLNEKFCSIDGILFSKDTTTVLYFPYYKTSYSDYRNYELPEKVQNIGRFAFYNSQFESLTLSDSLKTIADSAFYRRNYYSNQINSLILMNENIARASQTAFNDQIYQNTILYVPMGTQNEYLTVSPWSNFRNINSSKLAEEDYQLLKAFYEEMGNGEGWYRQWTFGETADETRITRGIRMIDDHVYSIDLSSNGLKGGLSDKLFKLPRLEILNLSNNQLSCPIDSVLNEENVYNTVLRELNVSNNKLTGNIGSVTNTLKNLTTLNVSNNKLMQVTPKLSSNIYSLNINYQTMDTIDYKSICNATQEYVEAGLPNLLFYDHNNRNYTTNRNFTLYNIDNDTWYMTLKNTGGIVSISEYSSNYRLYKRPNGDVLRLSDNGHSIPIRMQFDQGDVNFDTQVNVSDLQFTVNYAVSEKAEQLFNFATADIVTDNWVNVQDVVSLVNILLDQNIDTSNGSRAMTRAATIEENPEALLFWRGNKLILRTDKNIAAMDIAIGNVKDVKWLLDDVDYDFSISKQTDYVRIIHYSMARKDVKAGEIAIAEAIGEGMNILKADLVNIDGNMVKTIYKGTLTNIEELSNENADIKIGADITGVNIMVAQPMTKLQWVVYDLNGNMLGKGNTNLSSGSNSLKCNLAGENHVVVRLSNDIINITKKVSVSK